MKLFILQIVLLVLTPAFGYSQGQLSLKEKADSLFSKAKIFAAKSDMANYESTFFELTKLQREHADSLTEHRARILWLKADISVKKQNFNQAIIAIDSCLEFLANSPEKSHEHLALALSTKGVALEGLGIFQKAVIFKRKAYQITKSAKKVPDEDLARYANGMGASMLTLGKVDSAGFFLEEAIQLYEKDSIKNQALLAAPYTNMGQVRQQKNQLKEALLFYNKALRISVKLHGRYSLAAGNSYTGIGIVQEMSGNFKQAVHYKELALASYKKSLGPTNVYTGYAYLNLGVAYSHLNDYLTALENYLPAKKILVDNFPPLHPYLGSVEINLCIAYEGLNKLKESLASGRKAITIFKASPNSTPIDFQYIYEGMGSSFFKLQKIDSSEYFFDKALQIRLGYLGETHPLTIKAMAMLATVKALKGDKSDSEILWERTQAALQKQGGGDIENADIVSLINALSRRSDMLTIAYSKQPNDSLLHIANSANEMLLRAFDRLGRLNDHGTDIVFSDQVHTVLERLIVAKIHENEAPEKAFLLAEKGKGRFLQLVINNDLNEALKKVSTDLQKKEQTLKRQRSDIETRRFELIQGGRLATDTEVLNLSEDLLRNKQEQEDLQSKIAAELPEYFNAKYKNKSIDTEAISKQLIDTETSLVSYFVGDTTLYTFVIRVDKTSLKTARIDSTLRINISKMTKAGIYGYYNAPASRRSRRAKARADKNYAEAAHELYKTLIAPVKDQLTGKLIIIPDGALGYLPFEALLSEAPKQYDDFSAHHYLVEDHQVSYAYSATLLQEMKDKKHRREPEGERLAMAPFYRGNADTLVAHVDTTDLGFDFVLKDSLAVLNQSGPEIKSITNGEKDLAIYGTDATLARFQDAAADFRVLHLSSHARADDRSGDYAYLAFSQPDATDEFEKLYARDLYNMTLNADMVVLSACETGVGELQRGEGIVSLARAFAYAGAKSIFTTLWQVEENATRELVTDFYKYLDQGREKDEALRLAKLEYLKENVENSSLSHPFFWASMIGIGDMRSIAR